VGADRQLDNEIDLYLWDIAEATVTVMAACIPALRVLLRDATQPSSRIYSLSFSLGLSSERRIKLGNIDVAHENRDGGSRVGLANARTSTPN
jgi:hypothetical protein